MTELFVESMLFEQNQLLDKINVEIEEAKIALLESMDLGPFFEAKSGDQPQQSSSIFQAIINLLKALLKAIGDGFKKIGSWMTGAKVTPEGQNAKINGMDPNMVVKLVNGDLEDATDALRKAANGEMSIQEAKAFIDKKEAVWETLRSSMVPVVGLAAFFMGKHFTVDKWKAAAQNGMNQFETLNKRDDPNSDSKLAGRVARTLGDENKKNEAKAASHEIVNFMNRSTKRGLDFLMSPVREAYQKGYLKKEILKQADMMGTPEGRKELKKQDKNRTKAINAENKRTKIFGKNVTKAEKQGNKGLSKQINAEDKLDKTMHNVYRNY